MLRGLDGMFEGSITIRDGRPNATTPTVSLSVTRSGSTQTFTPFADPNAPYSTTTTSLKNYFANTGADQETDIHLIGDVVGTVWTLNITSKNLNGDSVLRPFSYTAGANGDTPSMTVVAKRLSEFVSNAGSTLYKGISEVLDRTMLDRREVGSAVEGLKTSTTAQIEQVRGASKALAQLRESLWTPDDPVLVSGE